MLVVPLTPPPSSRVYELYRYLSGNNSALNESTYQPIVSVIYSKLIYTVVHKITASPQLMLVLILTLLIIIISVTECICTLCLCCWTLYVALSVSVSSFFFCWVWGRIMTSLRMCYVLWFRLRLSETTREEARGNNNDPSHVPSKRKEEIKSGTSGCGSFVVPYFQPAISTDRLH